MAITWTNVTAVAPELSTVAVATQTAILAQVNSELSTAVWGSKIEIGRAWLAAHLGTIAGIEEGGGVVQSETVGAVSRTYAVGSGDYTSTAYGNEFNRLLMQLPLARFTISA